MSYGLNFTRLMVLLLFTASSCDDGSSGKGKELLLVKPSQVTKNDSVFGAFKFEERFHDFGEVPSGKKVSHVFKFTNVGAAPLVIEDISTSCGCTAVGWTKKPILPSQSGEIKVEFSKEHSQGLYVKTPIIKANVKGFYTSICIRANVLK